MEVVICNQTVWLQRPSTESLFGLPKSLLEPATSSSWRWGTTELPSVELAPAFSSSLFSLNLQITRGSYPTTLVFPTSASLSPVVISPTVMFKLKTPGRHPETDAERQKSQSPRPSPQSATPLLPDSYFDLSHKISFEQNKMSNNHFWNRSLLGSMVKKKKTFVGYPRTYWKDLSPPSYRLLVFPSGPCAYYAGVFSTSHNHTHTHTCIFYLLALSSFCLTCQGNSDSASQIQFKYTATLPTFCLLCTGRYLPHSTFKLC